MGSIRVALCDDHALVRSGLRMILERQSGVEVVGDVGTGGEAVSLAEQEQPDVFVVDLALPDDSGVHVAGRILEVSGETKVLIVTMFDDVERLRAAFDVGAHGYLVKEAADVELVLAVQTVAAGHRYVHPSLGAALLGDQEVREGGQRTAGPQLSKREFQVLRLLALGHTNAEIARELYLSVRTVETHRLHIQQKLGLRRRAELVQFARDEGIL
ncbi:MAG: response regulator transcription factor [Acidimicrobiia bacterium]|nr:response regulator transcription factor [Acidimicrobiia bacterium]